VTTAVGAFVLTAGIVSQATGGRLAAGSADRPFESVSTDSRTVGAGALFIALRGERFDGHAFVADVLARGASGAVVEESAVAALGDIGVADGSAAIVAVPDTLVALQALGQDVRRRSGARVIAITGSAGKTTTKEVTADLLASRYRVFRNKGNLNNHIGLPLSLIELRHGPDVAVVELGMNHAGEIRTLVGIAEPDMRVWINVGDAHIGHFGSREALADAKGEILEAATPSTVVVAAADDPLVMARVAKFPGRVVTFGEARDATVRATTIVDRGFDGTTAEVAAPAGTLHLSVPLAGRAQLSNVLAAVAVALELHVPVASIENRVSELHAVARRGASAALPNGARLIDDSYNASPAAVRAMLAALGETPVMGRRIAVLGEMLELGTAAHALHAACGLTAATSGLDELVIVGGPAADGLVDGALAGGFPVSHIHRFADSVSAREAVAALVGPRDLVLVKGSRGTRTDLIADYLLGRTGA
jgi:UDP-N-acetylmuramoyl-tripeptide--D-alanyl-D-alanine ligase